MLYSNFRNVIQSGDTIACKKRAVFSILIRIFTAESTNHTAVFLRDSQDGIWVTEMREGRKGFQITPASQWIREELKNGTVLTYCEAPEKTSPEEMRRAILQTRAEEPDYSYWTLLKVWWSQLLNKPVDGKLVCSTYAQHVHEEGGYRGYTKLADPGGIEEHSPIRFSITGI